MYKKLDDLGFFDKLNTEDNRTVTPLERVPVLDDIEDALRERGKTPSWINRILDKNIGGYENGQDSTFHSLLRQTMAYALIVFAAGLLIAIAYVMIRTL